MSKPHASLMKIKQNSFIEERGNWEELSCWEKNDPLDETEFSGGFSLAQFGSCSLCLGCCRLGKASSSASGEKVTTLPAGFESLY